MGEATRPLRDTDAEKKPPLVHRKAGSSEKAAPWKKKMIGILAMITRCLELLPKS